MNTLQQPDRKHAPAFGTLDQVAIAEAKTIKLGNGIPLFKIDAGTQDLVKIEFIFPGAGATSQPGPLVSVGTNDMLDEGTGRFSSSELAERIDYFGAFLQMESTLDFSSACLFCLNKHLRDTLPLLEEMIKSASFPSHEFDTYLQNKKQKFLTDEAKVSTIARKKFTQLLFGDVHPYGHYLSQGDFETLDRQQLLHFHQRAYRADSCHVVVSGKMDPQLDLLIDTHFGDKTWSSMNTPSAKQPALIQSTLVKKHFVEKKDAVQSAIRIGRLLFNKMDPDFMGMQVLNTIFGGYFGSRLMSNIREDKGYTYGIGSGIVSLKQAGYFFISTEVGVSVCKDALTEIYFEMARLRNELIPEEELILVKNYLLGTFLRSADGPFSLADKFKNIYDYGLDYTYYQRYVQVVKNITSIDLQALANKYLQEGQMTELVVGLQ